MNGENVILAVDLVAVIALAAITFWIGLKI